MIMGYARRLWHHFLTDNLFRNSIYLMLTTVISAGFGFFFWLIATHIFTPAQIGVGTTLISAMTLISFISLLGFNSTFVRILPNSKNRNNEINTGSILVISAAAIIAAGYIWVAPHITPSLAIVSKNIWYSLGFIIMVALASINSLTDSIFIAYRSAKYNLITDGFFTSGTKLLLPLLFVGLGAYGVFAAAGLAASIGMIASILFLIVKFDYRPHLSINKATLKDVFTYSFTNYVANLLNIAPTLILPIIVISRLGAPEAANYYLAFTIINLLYTISVSVSSSLFAEGSYGEGALRGLMKHASIILIAIMVPAALALAWLGPFVLNVFGKSYGEGGSSIVVLLAIGAPAVALYNIGGALLRIRQQVYSLVIINVIYAISIISLALLWVAKGLTWVAIAWIVGNLLAGILAFLAIFSQRGRPTPIRL